jgi:NADPH:quinone reductase-like Zn-dependent oxidoreductase
VRAFVLDRYGSADGVRAAEVPEPEVREDDVLVQVHAAGVNQLDSKIRDGEFKLILPYRLPLILGHDVAGVVVSVGSRVRRFEPGDEVYARPADGRIGAFAELIAISEDDVAIKPRALRMEEAASIPLVGLTAWQALVQRAKLQRGQKVLIHAGSGGVGTFAIQLARHLGATVATTTSTPNVDLVRSLGADVVIDYRKEDFADVLRDYDVVLNSLDKVTLEKSLRVLKPGGQLISISGPPDAAFARSIGASWILRLVMSALSYGIRAKAKRRQVRYSFLLMRADGGQLSEITSLIDDGIIRPVVDQVFPFASTREAMAYVEAGRATGKVVVSLSSNEARLAIMG